MRMLFLGEWGFEQLAIEAAAQRLGGIALERVHREQFLADQQPLNGHDVVLTYGPHRGGLSRLFRRLAECSPSRRPLLIWWLNENLPDLHRFAQGAALGRARLWLDAVPLPAGLAQRWRPLGHRYRLAAELVRARRMGLPMLIPCTSGWRAQQLAGRGLPTMAAPMGPDDTMGEDLGLSRDIDVGWIGRLDGLRSRRRGILDRIRPRLQAHGVTITELHGVYGDERTHMLNRCKILLNLLRHPQDWTGHRLLLGSLNGALVVSETMVDREPFVPGTHMVQADPPHLADAILEHLADEPRREAMTRAARALVQEELTMERALQRILTAAGRMIDGPSAAPTTEHGEVVTAPRI